MSQPVSLAPRRLPNISLALPVISTPIRDVVRPYSDLGLAHIATSAADFSAAMDHVLTHTPSHQWRQRAAAFLSTLSWDSTWHAMNDLILTELVKRRPVVRQEHAQQSGVLTAAEAK